MLPLHFFAQQPQLSFKHISIEQGLSNSTIECILQDNRGFIWFGTRDGLNRYDGNQVTIFRFDEKDSNSISDNFIRCIYEDRNHALWIGTNNGLNRFDPVTNRFTRYKQNPANTGSLSNNQVTCIYEDGSRVLWIATMGGGINVLAKGQNHFIHYRHADDVTASLNSDRVNYLYEDSKNNLWIGTADGLSVFERKTKSFKSFNGREGFTDGKENNILVIKEDRTGNLLLGTADNGLLIYNHKSASIQHYQHNEKQAGSLASNQVRTLLTDRAGNIWIGGVNGG
ncbi:MAG: two-component regulator propeller domain-containing protein, partial [Bacteroidota bacterium]